MQNFATFPNPLLIEPQQLVKNCESMKRHEGKPMPKHGTYRAKVLAVIDDRDCFLTAVDIVEQTELTYKQVIDVLQALHNEDLILRTGHKFTARWGSKKLEDHSASAGVQLLEDVFRGFFKK